MKTTLEIATDLNKALDNAISVEDIASSIERPKETINGDFAFPAFRLAKTLKKNPAEIASDIVSKLNQDEFEKIEAKGPYVNFFLKREGTSQELFSDILNTKNFGFNDEGKNKTITIDMSSPNIAKPMSMGHLRSTMIGNAIANISMANGYKVEKINHLGDWGTQFGLMIAAYKLWGDKSISEYSIDELVALYVRINTEAKENADVAESGRNWFKKLEDGDEEATEIWSIIREQSLKEFFTIYDRLGVSFDSTNGEAFYSDKMEPVVELLEQKGLLKLSQGATIVDLPELLPDENLPIAMVKRSDGATQYITRDLATAFYRKNTYDFAKSFYVVGSEQKDYFRQLKAILKMAGQEWSDDMEHITFGLITVNGMKMSTRKGNTVTLVEVLNASHDLAKKQIESKNPDLPNAEQVAEEVGIGAVIFNDLMNDRNLSENFDINEIVKFEGDTGPYVQYTNARIHSLLAKAGDVDTKNTKGLKDEDSWKITSRLMDYPSVVSRSFIQRDPSIIAKYVLGLSREFNSYYANNKILVEDENLGGRLALISSVSKVIESALELLGVKAPEKM